MIPISQTTWWKAFANAFGAILILALARWAYSPLTQARQDTPATDVVIQPPCNETAFDIALGTVQGSGGGTITFNCGTVTILFTGQKIITSQVIVDGEGTITLSGGFTTRFFKVNSSHSLTLSNLTLAYGRSGSDFGGAIWVETGGTLNVLNSTLQNNATTGYGGGAIVDFGGQVTLADSIVQNSTSSYGAIYSAGTLTLTNTIVRQNTASAGGAGVSVSGIATILNSQILSNTISTAGFGGGIYTTGKAQVTIRDSLVNFNQGCDGGAIHAAENVTINLSTSTFASNQTLASCADALNNGGAIFNLGTMILYGSTLSNNASRNGGAVYNRGTLDITNSTFWDNYASAYGNALYNHNGLTTIHYATFAANGHGTAFGQIVNDGTIPDRNITLERTIMDVTRQDPIAQGSCTNFSAVSQIVSDGANIFSDIACMILSFEDRATLDPKLNLLGDNGGGTQTMLPQPNSPAIDSISCTTSIGLDQRGVERPQGTTCDVGAVEVTEADWMQWIYLPVVIK